MEEHGQWIDDLQRFHYKVNSISAEDHLTYQHARGMYEKAKGNLLRRGFIHSFGMGRAQGARFGSAPAVRISDAIASLSDYSQKELTMMTLGQDTGIVDVSSHHSVDETVNRLKAILEAKGVNPVCPGRPQRRGGKGGHANAPHQVRDLRSPKAGTPLMLAAPRSAIDLPLKILVWEDANGNVLI